MIEETGEYPPFLVFPEGTTSHGEVCYNFKKGAFFNEKKIRPFVLKFKYGLISTAWDSIGLLELIILNMCWSCYSCDLIQLPDFEPNEYLFETHSDKAD